VNEWKVLGFIDASFMKPIDVSGVELWTIRFKPEEMGKIYSEWENQSWMARPILRFSLKIEITFPWPLLFSFVSVLRFFWTRPIFLLFLRIPAFC
jgi:hypothetical protein